LLNKFFHEAIIEELKREQKRTIDIIVNGQIMSLEANEYENRYAKSDTIKQRYELLSREYNSQNKVFEEKHKEIVAGEKQKREEII